LSTEFGSNLILIDWIRIESAAGSNPILTVQICTTLDRAVDFNERITAFTTGRACTPSSDIKGGKANIQLRCGPAHTPLAKCYFASCWQQHLSTYYTMSCKTSCRCVLLPFRHLHVEFLVQMHKNPGLELANCYAMTHNFHSHSLHHCCKLTAHCNKSCDPLDLLEKLYLHHKIW